MKRTDDTDEDITSQKLVGRMGDLNADAGEDAESQWQWARHGQTGQRESARHRLGPQATMWLGSRSMASLGLGSRGLGLASWIRGTERKHLAKALAFGQWCICAIVIRGVKA